MPQINYLLKQFLPQGYAYIYIYIYIDVPNSYPLEAVILYMGLQDIYKKYGKPMWYKNTHSVGVRRKFDDKKQIIYFGARSALTQEVLLEMGDECVKKLNGGMTEADVKAWAIEQCK